MPEDGGFLSRAVNLPDDLRGALLLPSESGSLSSKRTGESSLTIGESLLRADESFSGSMLEPYGLSPPSAAASSQPHNVGLSGAPSVHRSSPNSHSNESARPQSARSKSSAGRDWSLSDADLQELLEQDVADVERRPSARNLVSVPEARELTPGSALGPSSVSSRGQSTHTQSLETVSGNHTTSQSSASGGPPSPHVSPSSHSLASKSQSTTGSPPQCSQSSGSSLPATTWSSGARSGTTNSSSAVNPAPNVCGIWAATVCEDDLLEASINSDQL